jgi:hypothetical protein
MKTQRKVPAGPKAQPGVKGKAASSRKLASPTGTDPSGAFWGIKNTSKKHKSAVTGASRNTPSGQKALTSKARRAV